MRNAIYSYMDECRALFITGEMDIETEWDAYLSELEQMNYKGLIELDQAAWERTYGTWSAAE